MRNVFNRLTIAKKIGLVFIVLFAMMGIGGTVGVYNATQIAKVAGFLYKENFTRTETIGEVEGEFLSQRQELFLYIIVEDEGSRGLLAGTIAEHTDVIKALLNRYGAFGLEGKIAGDFDELGANLVEYWSIQAEVVGLTDAGDKDGAMALVRGVGNKSFNRTVGTLMRILEVDRQSAFEAYEKTGSLSKVITRVTIAVVAAAILMAAALWLAITNSIVKPILHIWKAARRMARGDLKQRAPVVSNDEIGTLAAEFNMMAKNLENYYEALKKRMEGEKKALAKASDMKSQFLANVSHELRTPLNSIIGFSELLEEKAFGDLNEKQLQYVEYINTSGSHLLQLINSILDLSKIEAGRMELLVEEFPLQDVLMECLGTIRPLAEKMNVTLHCIKEDVSPMVMADKARFKQILLNLLSNAVKFNTENGSVNVEWKFTEEKFGSAVKRFLVLTVTDTGIGIRQEDIDKLFGQFEQLDPSVSRERGGTGLGLALTKNLVGLHKGRIWVESEPGKGCVFSVKLPQGTERVEAPAFEVPPAARLKPDISSNPLILVAGESGDVTNLIEIYLSGENYRVVTAGDGAELIAKARQERPFAIVTGIDLPKKDGWEVMLELKRYPETIGIPVVIVSSSESKEIGFAMGAVDYLAKPVSRERLIETLARVTLAPAGGAGVSTILVVDDEPKVLDMLGDILNADGYEVLRAPGGQKAIDLAIEKNPDLIILDLMMPVVNGFDVVERLREHPVARNIPIIIFTAKDITPEDKVLLGTSIDNIIQKASFSKKDLLSEIRLLELAYPERANLVDPVTRLYNKRYFDEIFDREILKAVENDDVFSVLLVDIDDFGDFNHKYGYPAGDEALRDVAGLLASNLRKTDYVARGSSDSFLVLLSGITKVESSRVAEKIRGHVYAHPFSSEDPGVVPRRLTVSIATVTVPSGAEKRLFDVLDEVLNRAAASGGNMVCQF